MPIVRCLLTLLLACIVGGVIILWPHSPLWTQSLPNVHELVQFSQNGKSLIVAEGWCTNSAPTATPALVYFDLKTGKKTKRIPLTFPQGTFINKYWITPDAQTILAQVSTAKEGYNVSTGGTSLVAFDVASSKQLRGPLPTTNLHELQFSPDRRWFWYLGSGGDVSDLELSKTKVDAGLRNIIHIASAADFRHVLSILYDPSKQAFHHVGFFPDQPRIAVLYTQWPGKSLLELAMESPEELQQLQQVMEIWDLQTGKKTHSSLMPTTHRWYKIEKTICQNIYVRGTKVNPLKTFESLEELSRVSWLCEKELEASIEPMVSSTRPLTPTTPVPVMNYLPVSRHCMGFGDNWVCHSIVHDRTNVKLANVLRWIDAKTGTKLMDGIYPGHTICVKDRPSGKTRIEIVVKAGLNMRISDKGEYLVQADYVNHTLDLWNANPPSRWPYALATGLLICIIMMLLGRIRKVRRIGTA